MRPKDPTPQTENRNNAHRHNCIIQCLTRNRIRRRQTKDNRDETNPSHGDESNRTTRETEIEGSFSCVEFSEIDEPDEDGYSVGDVQADSGDGGCGCEGDGGTEGGEGEAESEEGGEPDGADGGAEAVVYFVEEVWL